MQNPQSTSLQRKDIVWVFMSFVFLPAPSPKKNLRKGWEDGSAVKAFDMKESRLVLKPQKLT